MRTVQELIDELRRFPPGAKCWAYEGEAIGIAVDLGRMHGFVYCGPKDRPEPDSDGAQAPEPPQPETDDEMIARHNKINARLLAEAVEDSAWDEDEPTRCSMVTCPGWCDACSPEPPQVDAEPIIGPMCSRCGTELASDDVECCEQVDAWRCEWCGGEPSPECFACNGTGRKGER